MNVTSSPADHVAANSDTILAYICIAMTVGVVGNALVLYAFRIEVSAFNSLLTVLGVFDSLACVFHMPLDIASLFDPYMFPDMALCKITCFMIAFTAIGSAILLVTIATMRYRAVCRPYSPNLSVKQANVISLIAFCTAITLSWPTVLMFGVTTIEKDGTVFAFCGVQNAYMTSPYPLAFYITLSCLFLVDFTALLVLYILTGRELWSKSKLFVSNKVQCSSNTETPEVSQFNAIQSQDDRSTTSGNKPNSLQVTNPCGIQEQPSMSLKRSTQRDKKTQMTFLMMSLVSVVFFLSYMPHLLLAFYFMAINPPGFPTSALTPWFGVLMRSFYINNVADPFIYGFFSNDFRKSIKAIPEKLRNICKTRY